MNQASPRTHRFQPRRRQLLRAVAACPPLLALAACGGGGGHGSSPVIGPGPAGASVDERHIRVSNAPEVSLQVRDWHRPGAPAGSAIVLLAGLGANARCFDSLAPALAVDFARVVAITRRGYGRSGKPLPARSATQYYEVDTLVSDLRAVLDELGLSRVVLCGHSIAGNELTRFAGCFPERTRGLVYLDTTFDYTVGGESLGETVPQTRALDAPLPTPEDGRSMQAAIAFARRLFKVWSPAQEANLRENLDVQPDGSVHVNTPEDANTAMETAAHGFSPDYAAVRAPSLVVTALPASDRDLFPWIDQPLDAQAAQDAADYLRILRRARIIDGDRLAAALKTRHRLMLDNSCHGDFFVEHEAEVLRAIRFMAWA